MKELTWIFENSVFPNGDVLFNSIKKNNKKYLIWDDAFWTDGTINSIDDYCLFHGSLANADRIARELPWKPGSFCNVKEFEFSFAYKNLYEYLLNQNCIFSTIKDVIENNSIINTICKNNDRFFTRPNSPLKHYSGRILDKHNLTPGHFDYGFYHDDINLPIVLAEIRKIESEWRFVVVNNIVATGCEYEAEGRKGKKLSDKNAAWEKAQEIASKKIITEIAYIIDICKSNDCYYLVEMNPFSGADLYFCDGEEIMKKIMGSYS